MSNDVQPGVDTFVRLIVRMEPKARVIGFDLARAYAILGMFIVNFNIVFGNYTNHDGLNRFLNLFNGNSSTLFVMLAGMGVALMSNRPEYSQQERKSIRSLILKRSGFLFVIGLLLFFWWPADILHFYGGYLHLAAFILFLPRVWYLISALVAVGIWHVLFFFIPFETGWNFETFHYADFWTVEGFFRNTFYNGWNPIFPWVAYFFGGMWLGRLHWQNHAVKTKVALVAAGLYLLVEAFRQAAAQPGFPTGLAQYLLADYMPPTAPFILSTASFGCLVIVLMLWLGEKYGETRVAQALVSTGQMTLTHYIFSLTLGMLLLTLFTGNSMPGNGDEEQPVAALVILAYSIVYFIASVMFSVFWKDKFRHGPMEMLMRKISG